MKIKDLNDESEFILSDYLGDEKGSGELRLTFYKKFSNVDTKCYVSTYGCIQFQVEKIKTPMILGLTKIIRPRFNNLTDIYTLPAAISGEYVIAQIDKETPVLSEFCTKIRELYIGIRQNIPHIIEKLDEDL